MKTLLNDVPENEQNFVLMDSTHSLSLLGNETAGLLSPYQWQYHRCKIHVFISLMIMKFQLQKILRIFISPVRLYDLTRFWLNKQFYRFVGVIFFFSSYK